MTKTILSLAFAAVLSFSLPASVQAEAMIEITDNMDIDDFGISIGIEQSVLHVSGAAGQVLQIYNVAGVCVMTVKVDGDDKRYDLNLTRGCYIVKVGKVVRKISIR